MKIPLLSLCLLLVGCAAKSGQPTVRISYVGTGLQTWCLPVVLAQSLGYFQDEGLNVVLESLPSTGKGVQALVGGSVDVATISQAQIIQVTAEGQRLRSFFILTQMDDRVLVASPTANARIQRVEDLKGAMVGVASPGSGTHIGLNLFLNAHGMLPSDVSLVTVGVGPAALAAIELGKVDAAVVAGGDHIRLQQRHPSLRILMAPGTPEGMRKLYGVEATPGMTLASTPNWLSQNQESARKLGRAMRRTLVWMATNSPQTIYGRLPDSLRTSDHQVDIEIIQWGRQGYTKDGSIPKGGLSASKRALDLAIDKVRDSNMDLAATWTNEFLPEPK